MALTSNVTPSASATESHPESDKNASCRSLANKIEAINIHQYQESSCNSQNNEPFGESLNSFDSISPPSKSTAQCKNPKATDEILKLLKNANHETASLSNEDIVQLMIARQISPHRLESILGKVNATKCVEIRRLYYERELALLDEQQRINSEAPQILIPDQGPINPRAEALRQIQSTDYDYERVVGACCENVIGCVRVPVGLVGPLKMDNLETDIYVPMATTEGCLVASTSRGLSALAKCGGVLSKVRENCMTRAPIVRFHDSELSAALNNVDRAMNWLQDPLNKEKIRAAFRATSKHATLRDYTLHPQGREIHIRFEANTGDAMGMNMLSKGAEAALRELQRVFPTMDILTLSGNMCTDKKPSAINWISGRGKSVQCSAKLSPEVVDKILKVNVDSLIQVWEKKVMIGSAMAGSIGGFNCHAANIVAAIYIATGQDVAQVVSSSNCLLTLEKDSRGQLEVHCSMPSIECGTVGGGTVLQDQSNFLQLMGIRGPTRASDSMNPDSMDSNSNACKFARAVCATVMAAELSLLASLTEGTLVKSHMTYNRSAQTCKLV